MRPGMYDLTIDQVNYVYENGYMIQSEWESPPGRYIYKVYKRSDAYEKYIYALKILAYKTTCKAAYNWIKKQVEKQKLTNTSDSC